MTSHLWVGFTGGLLAFAHCLGMCGGFVLHLSGQPGGGAAARQVLWHTGRIVTYLFLGALAGYSGQFLKGLLQHTWLQNVFSYLSGAIMILMGLAVLGMLPVGKKTGASGDVFMAGFFSHALFIHPSPGSALVLGMTTACLPCPIVIAFLAYAVQTQSVAGGIAVMAGMGLGTLVPLLLLGTFSSVFNRWSRRWGRWVGSAILIVLGVITMLRGSSAFHQVLGCQCHSAGESTSGAGSQESGDVRSIRH